MSTSWILVEQLMYALLCLTCPYERATIVSKLNLLLASLPGFFCCLFHVMLHESRCETRRKPFQGKALIMRFHGNTRRSSRFP